MDPLAAKLLSLVIIFAVSFLCSLLPIKVAVVFEKLGNKGDLVLSVLMCFGGGVFFSTFLLHMLPESRILLEYYWLKHHDIMYPVSELLIGLGFLMVLILDKLIEHCASTHAQIKHEIIPLCKSDRGTYDGIITTSKGKSAAIADENEPKDDKEVQPAELSGSSSTDGTIAVQDAASDDDLIPAEVHGARALILLAALSFHRLFEGMSVGLQLTSSHVLSLTLAIVCHESVVGFSLGLK